MAQKVLINVFLIRRLHVELKVILRSTGLVVIEPFQCKQENLRLWTSIAKTQSVLAQTQIQQEKGADYFHVLHTLFRQEGWDVIVQEERVEYSL